MNKDSSGIELPNLLDHITLRNLTEADVPFIYSSWLKSYRSSAFASQFPNDIYFDGHKWVIERVLERSIVRIAVSKEDPSLIYGWVCFEEQPKGLVLHYVYVKHAFREFGIGRHLAAVCLEEPCQFSHEGRVSHWMMKGSQYNPWAAFGGE